MLRDPEVGLSEADLGFSAKTGNEHASLPKPYALLE
jgi:hypothetical protein